MVTENLNGLVEALVQVVVARVTQTLYATIRKEVAAQLAAPTREAKAAPKLPAPRFSGPRRVRIAELEHRLGVHRTTIWRHCRDGRFPRPHYIGEQRAWWLHEIEAWEATAAVTKKQGTVSQATRLLRQP